MGGIGTIALEAAYHWKLVSLSVDRDPDVSLDAAKNVACANFFLKGHAVALRGMAEQLLQVEDGAAAAVVVDMPYNNLCRITDKGRSSMLTATGRILRPGGRAVLLSAGGSCISALAPPSVWRVLLVRDGLNISGLSPRLVVLERRPSALIVAESDT
eukprot:GHVT01052702.1.p1 GENE.GHVT01052702.1~~GHVT01052702.1.p1  ORF type:complete len:169 (+),score=46.55 GHVT01052702.1:38-508(+)